MPPIETIDVPATIAFMKQTFGSDAAIAARSTLSYMHLTSDSEGVRGWTAVVAALDAVPL